MYGLTVRFKCGVLLVATTMLNSACMGDPRAPFVDDSRACAGSNVELEQVADAFGVQLPASATAVRFWSDQHPLFGEYTLKLTFTLDRELLDQFVENSGFDGLHRLRGLVPPSGFEDCPSVDWFPEHPMGARKDGGSSEVTLFVVGESSGSVDLAVLGYEF